MEKPIIIIIKNMDSFIDLLEVVVRSHWADSLYCIIQNVQGPKLLWFLLELLFYKFQSFLALVDVVKFFREYSYGDLRNCKSFVCRKFCTMWFIIALLSENLYCWIMLMNIIIIFVWLHWHDARLIIIGGLSRVCCKNCDLYTSYVYTWSTSITEDQECSYSITSVHQNLNFISRL